MKVFLQGHGEVSLTQNDFVARGGQASVYVKGGTAYKVYTDPKDAIPADKFHALAAIQDPAVIKPKVLLLDQKGNRIGYAMDGVSAPHSLCQLFTVAFRDRHKVGPEKIPLVASQLRSHVLAVHQAKIVIVDLNELNILVPDSFDDTFLIDVDSYQTPQFPATVIMPSVRDWQSKGFTELSDWYSYAILAFQLFVGAHPFKGSFQHPEIAGVPKDGRLEWRMRRNFSAFRKEATLPACCPPFSIIPTHFKDWLVAVLDEGKRLPPPDPGSMPAPLPVGRVQLRVLESDADLILELLEDATEFIAGYDDGVFLLRTNGVPTLSFLSGRWTGDKVKELGTGRTLLGLTPKMGHPVAFQLDRGVLTFHDFEHGLKETRQIRVDEIAKSDDRFYVRSGSGVFEVAFSELPNKVVFTTTTKVADVLPKASRLYEGCAVQSMLGSCFVSLFPRSRAGYQVKMPELDGKKVLDAKFGAGPLGGVLMTMVARPDGKYDRHVFRFDEKFSAYDHRVASDVDPDLLNFVVLSTGICVCLASEGGRDQLEAFAAVKDSPTLRKINSSLLGSDLRLTKVQGGVGFTRGNELYRLKLR